MTKKNILDLKKGLNWPKVECMKQQKLYNQNKTIRLIAYDAQ